MPRDTQISTLNTIFANNVMKFGNGEMGATNGMAADGSILRGSAQGEEVWAGTNFSLVGLFLSEGMKDEAFKTLWGVCHVVYETKDYWFRISEAWNDEGNSRASMYMRPTAVWAMEMVTQ